MLSIRNIVKQYANHRALDNVSIEIEKGSVFGLLGPNGAGKTSLIRIINQITAPDQGEIFLNGEKLNPSHISKIGYLPEERGLYKKMEIGEQMLYLAQLKGLSKTDATARIRYWFEKMGIQSWWNKKVEDLSKGMQQKVQFIATVVHDPELIILDEPFSGFDPVNAQLITNEILELNQKGATIIFSTHRMESVEQLCDSIALIHKSKKILDGKVKDIKNLYRNNTYRIAYSGILNPVETPLFNINEEKKDEEVTQLTIQINPGYSSNDVLKFLIPQVQVTELTEIVPSMNDIFIQNVKN
ncbi:MAG: ABC transporter ATP-binding protein [Sphingobacteriales bacterium 17-39-43]|uniref:ABC transporter ATP-binding protein n=1 Tax=Daejeonella sp. TaxID=2805397 RepID=UPI000BDDB206|nr:ABC transporter ATP-binding protein [Daejeonella sp.]OYZ30409.1 MAG: ABC transporter ATP-binding protein [Sphingobacteriales bacterium 16-39-50]OZA23021.1 MAG: ABC transporter ATP-binding protein [Sphingobacteriales bacterium 17-39-43]HQT24134.1 ABC transporter ATP-binding protein [Daejeonella sp.]HQT58952.1 ABC transporter ATP-binding protein [Daejeonella sp.]